MKEEAAAAAYRINRNLPSLCALFFFWFSFHLLLS